MSNPMPRVSVLMSVHNGERFLREAIESILAQTFTDFEFVIVDDASDDATPVILGEYAARDPRIVLLRLDKNIGLTAALNRGLDCARGTFVARQDADDLSDPERLRRQIDFLAEHPAVVLAGSSYTAIDDSGGRLYDQKLLCGHEDICRALVQVNQFGHGSVMFRRGAGARYDERFRVAQDYDLFTRLALAGRVANLPESLYQWRTHAASITARRSREQERNRRRISDRYIAGLARAGRIDILLGALFNDTVRGDRRNAVRKALARSRKPDAALRAKCRTAVAHTRGESIHLLACMPLLARFTGSLFALHWLTSYLPRLAMHALRVISGKQSGPWKH